MWECDIIYNSRSLPETKSGQAKDRNLLYWVSRTEIGKAGSSQQSWAPMPTQRLPTYLLKLCEIIMSLSAYLSHRKLKSFLIQNHSWNSVYGHKTRHKYFSYLFWKDWRQKDKRVTEDEMVGWHHQLNGHEFEQTPEDSTVQGRLVCCSPLGRKELDTT